MGTFGSGRLKLRELLRLFEISLYNIARLHLKPNKTNNKQTNSYENKTESKRM